MHYTRDQINDLEKIKKINLINSCSGYKSANLIGTISKEGITNVAVFSSVTHLGSNPPTLGFILRPTTVPRDTYKNILESGVFTINHIFENIIEDAHHTSAKYEEVISEFDITGLEDEYYNDCIAPFVKGSPVQMEMKFIEEYHIKSNNVIHIIAEIKNLYVKDDILNEDCVERMMKMMLSDSNIGIVYAKRHFIYQEETEAILEFKRVYGNLHQYWTNFKVKDGIISGKEYLKDRNFLNAPKNKIGEPTSVLLNKSCFKKVGYFNEDMKQALDVEYWSRLMPFYKIGFVDDVLTSFRLHDAQASAVNKAGKVNETEALYHIYYKTLLKYLHKDCRWKLLKKFHPILSRLLKLKTKFGKNA